MNLKLSANHPTTLTLMIVLHKLNIYTHPSAKAIVDFEAYQQYIKEMFQSSYDK